MPAGTNFAALPFDKYVKIAASDEIQNFTKLLGLKPFVSEYGIKGYETYWRVIKHEDTDKGEINEVTRVGPLYYFPLQRERKLGDQPVKTVLLTFNAAAGKEESLKKDAEEIARSFRYLNRFMGLFSKKHQGKKFMVMSGVPFRIELPANPTTGYNWYITEMDENMFHVITSGYSPEKRGLIGGGGTSYFEIVPLKEGKSNIRLSYYRPWEGKGKAVDQYQIRVIVK
jgi:inhibitor of cysteine peptidase